MDPITYLIHGGRPEGNIKPVNPPLMRASTILFDSMQTWRETRTQRQQARVLSYGARGTETGFALERMMTTLEGGHRCQLFPTGLAAIAFTIMGYVRAGGHVLFSDAVYEPVRQIAETLLRPYGVEYDFFRADGGDVEQKIRTNTQLIFAESPGSLLYEMLDLPALCRLAHARAIPVAVDNTWGSAFLYHPLRLGADVSVIAATKYLGGHSDVMMGMMVASEAAWQQIGALPEALGQTASPDEAALVLRGMRTLALRMAAHGAAALQVARWLQGRSEVARVHCPALPDHPGHALWQRDCSGSNGLLTLEFAPRYSQAQADAFIDALTLFGIGASWGGFESLALPASVHSARSVTDWHSGRGPYVRLHIGLESVDALIADLQQALSVL